MKLSDVKIGKIYEVIGFYFITAEGKQYFLEKHIKKGTIVYIEDITSYDYILMKIAPENMGLKDSENRLGISLSDATVVLVEELKYK